MKQMCAQRFENKTTHLLTIGNKLVLLLLVKGSWQILLALEVDVVYHQRSLKPPTNAMLPYESIRYLVVLVGKAQPLIERDGTIAVLVDGLEHVSRASLGW